MNRQADSKPRYDQYRYAVREVSYSHKWARELKGPMPPITGQSAAPFVLWTGGPDWNAHHTAGLESLADDVQQRCPNSRLIQVPYDNYGHSTFYEHIHVNLVQRHIRYRQRVKVRPFASAQTGFITYKHPPLVPPLGYTAERLLDLHLLTTDDNDNGWEQMGKNLGAIPETVQRIEIEGNSAERVTRLLECVIQHVPHLDVRDVTLWSETLDSTTDYGGRLSYEEEYWRLGRVERLLKALGERGQRRLEWLSLAYMGDESAWAGYADTENRGTALLSTWNIPYILSRIRATQPRLRRLSLPLAYLGDLSRFDMPRWDQQLDLDFLNLTLYNLPTAWPNLLLYSIYHLGPAAMLRVAIPYYHGRENEGEDTEAGRDLERARSPLLGVDWTNVHGVVGSMNAAIVAASR